MELMSAHTGWEAIAVHHHIGFTNNTVHWIGMGGYTTQSKDFLP
jgi:ketopantoate hydroxymethyltransferase